MFLGTGSVAPLSAGTPGILQVHSMGGGQPKTSVPDVLGPEGLRGSGDRARQGSPQVPEAAAGSDECRVEEWRGRLQVGEEEELSLQGSGGTAAALSPTALNSTNPRGEEGQVLQPGGGVKGGLTGRSCDQ